MRRDSRICFVEKIFFKIRSSLVETRGKYFWDQFQWSKTKFAEKLFLSMKERESLFSSVLRSETNEKMKKRGMSVEFRRRSWIDRSKENCFDRSLLCFPGWVSRSREWTKWLVFTRQWSTVERTRPITLRTAFIIFVVFDCLKWICSPSSSSSSLSCAQTLSTDLSSSGFVFSTSCM